MPAASAGAALRKPPRVFGEKEKGLRGRKSRQLEGPGRFTARGALPPSVPGLLVYFLFLEGLGCGGSGLAPQPTANLPAGTWRVSETGWKRSLCEDWSFRPLGGAHPN